MSYSVVFVVAIVVMKYDLCIVVLGDTFLVVFLFSFVLYFCLGFQSCTQASWVGHWRGRASRAASYYERAGDHAQVGILWGIFKQKRDHIWHSRSQNFSRKKSKTVSGYQPKTVPDVQVLEDKYECPTCVRGSSKMDEQVLHTEVWWDSDWV